MPRPELFLKWFIRYIGSVSMLAAFAVVMPYSWMNAIHGWLGMGELPADPIVGYLSRSTSAFYALFGGLLWLVSFDLPGRQELAQVFTQAAAAAGMEPLEEAHLTRLTEAAMGLSLWETENAASLCLAAHAEGLLPEVIAETKADMIRQSASLEIGRFAETLEDLKGVERMREFVLKSLASASGLYRGIFGLPGRGARRHPLLGGPIGRHRLLCSPGLQP